MLRSSGGEVRAGESADEIAHGGEAVAARGREGFGEAEFVEERGIEGDDVGGCGAAVEFAEQRNESAHDGRFGIGAEAAASVSERGNDPHGRDAAGHAGGGGAFDGGEWRGAAGALHDSSEALLRVVEDAEAFDELELFGGEGHAGSVSVKRGDFNAGGAAGG